MSKKKKRLDEGAVMLTSLLPVGNGVIGLGAGRKPDNFEFKGLPGQFDKNGKKIMDEHGDPIKEDFNPKFRKKASEDYNKLKEAKETVRKVMVSEKVYSKSNYTRLKKIYQDLQDASDYLFDDGELEKVK